jgi:hypothetical protein
MLNLGGLRRLHGYMSDLLAIVDTNSTADELVDEILRRHPDRVTLLIEDGWLELPGDASAARRGLPDRAAALRAAIEARTGAVVVGLANSREQLRGWRFDRIVGGRQPRSAV